MLKIWGRRSSSNVQALMWCVGELGLAYKRYDAGHIYGVTKTDAFLEMNPNGTVPVLLDGEAVVLWETGAILRYLSSAYGADTFWPEDVVQRARVDKWSEWSKINVAMAFTGPVFGQVLRTPKKRQDHKAIVEAVHQVEKKLQIAERQLKDTEWLCGPELTLADIQFGHVLFRYFDIEIERQSFPSIKRYFEALMSRKAYLEHVAISYDELRPPKSE